MASPIMHLGGCTAGLARRSGCGGGGEAGGGGGGGGRNRRRRRGLQSPAPSSQGALNSLGSDIARITSYGSMEGHSLDRTTSLGSAASESPGSSCYSDPRGQEVPAPAPPPGPRSAVPISDQQSSHLVLSVQISGQLEHASRITFFTK